MSDDSLPVDPFGFPETDIYGKKIISDEEYIKRYGKQEFDKWIKRDRDAYLSPKMNRNAKKKLLEEVRRVKWEKRDSELAKEWEERMKRLERVEYK